MFDPVSLGIAGASALGSLWAKNKENNLKTEAAKSKIAAQNAAAYDANRVGFENNKNASLDYTDNLGLARKQTQSDVGEAGARTAFGNNFLKGYGDTYGGLVDRNTANEATRLDARMGAIQPTVNAFAAPAQNAERAGLAAGRTNAATAAMGPQATSAAIPLAGGQGQGATAAEYDKRFAKANADATNIAGRQSALGSWDDIWNRNNLREAETQRGLGVAEAFGKSKADVINEGVKTNTKSLQALPDLQELVGVQARGAPINPNIPRAAATPSAPIALSSSGSSLADLLGGLSNVGAAYAGSKFGSMELPDFSSFLPASGPSVVPRPTLFGR